MEVCSDTKIVRFCGSQTRGIGGHWLGISGALAGIGPNFRGIGLFLNWQNVGQARALVCPAYPLYNFKKKGKRRQGVRAGKGARCL